MRWITARFWMVLWVGVASPESGVAAGAANDLFTAIDRCNAEYNPHVVFSCYPVIDCLKNELERQYSAFSNHRNTKRSEFKRLIEEYEKSYDIFFLEIVGGHKSCDCGSGVGVLIERELIPDLHQILGAMIELRRSDIERYHDVRSFLPPPERRE